MPACWPKWKCWSLQLGGLALLLPCDPLLLLKSLSIQTSMESLYSNIYGFRYSMYNAQIVL